jgi:hypothetical protein
MDSLSKLAQLLEGFLVTQDTHPNRGRDIEGYIAIRFDSDHPLHELANEFAQYSSSGGEYLFDDAYMVSRVSLWLQRIRSGEFGDCT